MPDRRLPCPASLPRQPTLWPRRGAIGPLHEVFPPMTMRLILTRHAKSDWGDPMLDDHDRPLNARGRTGCAAHRRMAEATGASCRKASPSPPRDARRKHGTASPPASTRRRRRRWPRNFTTHRRMCCWPMRAPGMGAQMLIGHNPGMAEAAHRLAGQAARPSRALPIFPPARRWCWRFTAMTGAPSTGARAGCLALSPRTTCHSRRAPQTGALEAS